MAEDTNHHRAEARRLLALVPRSGQSSPGMALTHAVLAVADAIEAQTLAISQLFPMTDGEGTPIVRTWPFEPEPTDPAGP